MQVTLITDTRTKDFTVKAGPSPKFVFGNLLFMQLCPVAYAVDFTNQKRFYYGKSINLDANDTVTVLRPMPGRLFKRYADKRYPVEKGQIFLELSAPYMNGFYMQPRNEPTQGYFGFFGFSAGVSYYYKNHKYLKLGGSAATDFLVPVPLPITRDGAYESADIFNFTLTDNHKFNRFTVGYGFNYAINQWKVINHDYEWPPNRSPGTEANYTRQPITKISHGFGFTLSSYHQINCYLHAGIVYSPSVYNVYPSAEFKYQHLLSFDILVKLRVKKQIR